MRCGAATFKNSSGSASTYQQSRQVTRIDAFISHNWSVSRRKKYVALIAHFNVKGAMAMTVPVVAIICVCQILGYLPEATMPWASHPRGVCIKLLTPLIFLSFLFLGRDMCWLLGGAMGPMVFVDKVCIDQTSNTTIGKGVAKLGAMLHHSSCIAAIYTDVYLHKLWTVYEMASFLILHSTQGLYIIPEATPTILLAGVAVGWAIMAATTFIEALTGFEWALECSLGTIPYSYCLGLRQLARQRVQIHGKLAAFTVHNANCFIEDDRKVIYRNIASLMHWTNKVDSDATEEEALMRFDALVREQMREAFDSSVGPSGIRYVHAVAIGFAFSVGYQLDKLTGIRHGLSHFALVTELASVSVISFAIVPLYIFVASRLGSRLMKLKGCCEKVYLFMAHAAAFEMGGGVGQEQDGFKQKWGGRHGQAFSALLERNAD